MTRLDHSVRPTSSAVLSHSLVPTLFSPAGLRSFPPKLTSTAELTTMPTVTFSPPTRSSTAVKGIKYEILHTLWIVFYYYCLLQFCHYDIIKTCRSTHKTSEGLWTCNPCCQGFVCSNLNWRVLDPHPTTRQHCTHTDRITVQEWI